jgi:hypothetical protein
MLLYICLLSSNINTLFTMLCCETCSVFRVDHGVWMTGHLLNRVIELIVLQAESYAQRGSRSKNNIKKKVIYGFRVDCVWNVMAHAHKPDFVFRRNRRFHLNRRGHQFCRLLAADVCESAVLLLDTTCSEVVLRVLATHSIRRFPLPCVTLCHHISTRPYHKCDKIPTSS